MRPTNRFRPGLLGLVVATALLAGCGDDGGDTSTTGALIGSTGVLTLACPGSVTAGAKIVNGFSAALIQANGTPVANTFIGITPSPNQGDVFAPAEASAATFGGNTDTQGRLAFGFTAPAGAANNSSFQLVAKSGTQTASCRVTVQTAALMVAAPTNNAVRSVCTPVRLSASSTASGDASVRVASTVDATASDGGLLTTSATACTGSTSLSGLRISGTTGDFQNPLYVVAPSATTTTVTLTDSADPTRTANIAIQFVDQAASLSLDVDKLQVNPSPSAARFANLTATVYNASGRAVVNQPIRFAVESGAGGANADRLNPTVRVTGTTGAAVSRYEAGSNTGNATVSACVQDTSICDRRTITVSTAAPTGTGTGTTTTAVSQLVLDADLQVSPSPSAQRFSNLVATLYDAGGRAVANQAVAFSVVTPVGGTNADRVSPPVSTAGADGKAASRYEAGSNAGNATVKACVQNTTVCDTRTIAVNGTTSTGTGGTGTTGVATQINLDTDAAQVNASPSGTRFAGLTARVYDAGGRTVANQAVTFSVVTPVGGTANTDRVSPTAGTTDTNGAATSRYEAGSNTGNATVSACIQVQNNPVCSQRTITVAAAGTTPGGTTPAGQPSKVNFGANVAQVNAAPSTSRFATLTATVLDANNQAVANQTVTFAIQSQPGGTATGTLTPTSATTNSAGVATTTYEAGTGTGSAIFRACVPSANVCGSDVTVTVVASGASTATATPSKVTFGANATQVNANPSASRFATLTATVLDANNQAVANQTVTFAFQTQTGGNPSDSLSTKSATTNSAGVATTTYEAGANTGAATVRACVPSPYLCGPDVTITVSAATSGGAGAPSSVSASASAQQVDTAPSASRFSTVTATVLDANNQPVANQTVTFTFQKQTGGDPSDKLNQTSGTTNSSGVATATYEAGGNAGSAVVRACVPSPYVCAPDVTVTVVEAGRPRAVQVSADRQQVNAAPSASRFANLTVTVLDAKNQPVANQTVTFAFQTQTGGNPSDKLSQTSGTTNGSGVVTTTYEAGSNTGSATIRACAPSTGVCGPDLTITVNP